MSEFCKLHMIITAQEVERGNDYEMVDSGHMEGFGDKHETAAPDVFDHETDGTGGYPKYPQICHHQKMRKCIRR